ncbi:hypothetical protein CHLNCDRAFT_140447 [Chlorella variabilis]|uniref:THUMP domain-containing protein n=1 Tax=Chlorella variabilis TaxID=554065 RepID=E1Z5E5_CHLVA|nr:hypothetical protein CHLNCDRAFT_140447 [Chlorella variabilis]EFN58455.1 hypothetical protein CHLNCDRAFT_140447 [Chlorella variabilis]|eukprot:XP_005850557.1 hypothetical protein CHLNCDRAFT_140447 [Chlorella variabilis]
MPRAAVREETVKLEADVAAPTEAHLDDEARLRQLGYKQELRRELNLLRNFAVSFGLLSMLTGLGGFYYIGFTYGGPVVVIWGWILIVTMTLTIALSMAEICSTLPSTGGVYYWAGVLGGKQGPLWSWMNGWFNLLGQVGITAGVEWTVVNYLTQLINIFRGPEEEPFSFTKVQFWLRVSDSQQGAGRFCSRFYPVERTCYASMEKIEELAAQVVRDHFPADAQEPIEFAVVYDARAAPPLDRMEVINAFATRVPAPHKVNLGAPHKAILVNVVKGVCGVAVVERFKELCRYNIRTLALPEEEREAQREAQRQQSKAEAAPAAAAAPPVEEGQAAEAADAAAAGGVTAQQQAGAEQQEQQEQQAAGQQEEEEPQAAA